MSTLNSSYKTPIRQLIFIVSLITCISSVANVHIKLNGGNIEVFSDVSDPVSTIGLGPGSIKVDYVDTDSCVYTVFESCGCSEYYINQTSESMLLDVYSILGIVWGTDCCREDQPPFNMADADLKFSFSYDENGLKGKISIIDNLDLYSISQLPAMDYVITHPDECTKEFGMSELMELGGITSKILNYYDNIKIY